MRLIKPSSNRKYKRALITEAVKVLISYAVVLFGKLLMLIVNNRMSKDNDVDNIASDPKENYGYLVCWLSTLAQQHLRIIKTEDAYAMYSENVAVGSNFYLINTCIEDKANLHTVSDREQAKCVSFKVLIHSIAYTGCRYNRWVSKAIELYIKYRNKASEKWLLRNFISFKPLESVRRLGEKKFSRIKDRADGKRGRRFLARFLKSINEPIELRLELQDSLPCGICQFKIIPTQFNRDIKEIDGSLWKCIFDEIHQFFHDHHYPPGKSLLANKPRFFEDKVDITTLDNEIVRHYITTIGENLINQLDDIYRSYQILVVTNKTKREKGQKKISNRKLMDSAMRFFESCDILIGVHAFLNSVINSPQNSKIVLTGAVLTEEEIHDRETAMRIEGAYRGTIALMQRISHHHDFRNNHKSIQKAKRGIYWSIGFGLAGLVLSLVLAYEKWHKIIEGGLKSFEEVIINFFS